MTKIAFIHNNFPAGGAERVTIDIAAYLSSFEGYEVYVYASRISEVLMTEDMRKTFTLRKIPTQAVPSRRAREIERHVVNDGIDVLVQVTKAIPGIEDIKKNTGVKTVVSCHGEPFWQRHAIVYRRQKGLVRKIMWNLYNKKRYEDGTLAMKKAVSRTLREYNNCDAYTVLCKPYKYTVDDVNYSKENILLFCGRFENWSKRIDRLLRIWSKVQDKMSDWRLVLVGDGENWEELKQMAADMSLERVSFEGRRTNVADYYRKASVVALTSETEGWPLALTEAQAQGCICIAFGCTSGIREVLSPDKECGFIVSPYDEDEYARILLSIVSMPEEEKLRVRKNSVAKRLEYVPESIAEKWRLLFDEICAPACENENKSEKYESI